MRGRATARGARLRAGLALLAALAAGGPLSLAGCERGEPARPASERGAEAAEALRRFSSGRFEVVSFRPGEAREREYRDDFGFATRVVELSFDAELRLLAPLSVMSSSELVARSREPGWQPEQMDDGFQLLMLLGEGQHEAGRVERVHGAAVFDRLLPGERFRAFDRVR